MKRKILFLFALMYLSMNETMATKTDSLVNQQEKAYESLQYNRTREAQETSFKTFPSTTE